MLRDLGLVALVVAGAAVMLGVMTRLDSPRSDPAVRVRVMCYVQTVRPVTIVCPDQAYLVRMGGPSSVPAVPKS